VEAWQHVKLTVTNCSFGLTIKFTVDAKWYCASPSIFELQLSAVSSQFSVKPIGWAT
jgi:hypothetical protein